MWYHVRVFEYNSADSGRLSNEGDIALESELLDFFENMNDQLKRLHNSGRLDSYEHRLLKRLIKTVAVNLARKYDRILKGVESIMGGRVLEYEEKDILNRGIEQGLDLGREDGIK